MTINDSLDQEQETRTTVTARLYTDSKRLQINDSKTILARPTTSITFGLVYKTSNEHQKLQLITVAERSTPSSASSDYQRHSIFLSDRDENCNVKLRSFYFFGDALFDALRSNLRTEIETEDGRVRQRTRANDITPEMFYVEIENEANAIAAGGNRFFRRCNFEWRNTKIRIRPNEIVNFRPKNQSFAFDGIDGRESIVTINMNDALGNYRDLVMVIAEAASKKRKPVARINSELLKVRPGTLDSRLFVERIDRLWATKNEQKPLASIPWEDITKFYITNATIENGRDKVRNLIYDITYLLSGNVSRFERNEIFEYLNETLRENVNVGVTLGTKNRRRRRTFGTELQRATYRKSNAMRFFRDITDSAIQHLMRSTDPTEHEIERSTIKSTRCANRTIARTSNCAKYKQKRVSGRSLTIDLLLLPQPVKRTIANRHSLAATSNGQLFTNCREFTFLERTKLIAITVCPEATSENVNLAWFEHNENSEEPPVSLAIPYSEKHDRPTTIDTCITFILNGRYLRAESSYPRSPRAKTFSTASLRQTIRRLPYELVRKRKNPLNQESQIFTLRGDATLTQRLANSRNGPLRIPIHDEQLNQLVSIRLDPTSLIATNEKESTEFEHGLVSRVNERSRTKNSTSRLKHILTIVRNNISFVTQLMVISQRSIDRNGPNVRLHDITNHLKRMEQEYAKQTFLFLDATKREKRTTRLILSNVEQLFRTILLIADELLFAKDYEAYRNLNILLFDIRSQLTTQRE